MLVSIFNGAFSPETVTTAVGKSVRWTNNDVVVHTVVSDSAQFTSMDLAPTWWVEKRFDSAGVFNVRCTVHGTEKGAVIVQ